MDVNLINQSDLFITQHSNCDIVNYLMTGAIDQKLAGKCSSYIQVIYMCMKLANHYEIDPLIIPLDFLHLQKGKLQAKQNKLIRKVIETIKSIIYELSFETNQRLKTVVLSINEGKTEKDIEERNQIIHQINVAIDNIFS